MAEVPSSRLLANLEPAQKGMAIRADPPLVVTQHMTAKRKFILINSQVRIFLGCKKRDLVHCFFFWNVDLFWTLISDFILFPG